MAQKHTLEELNNCSREELITIVLMMQGQLDTLNDNIEKLIEQVRIANYRFGKHTETLKLIEDQLSFFDEAEAACDEPFGEPSAEEVLPAKHRAKKKGQRDSQSQSDSYRPSEGNVTDDSDYGQRNGEECG